MSRRATREEEESTRRLRRRRLRDAMFPIIAAGLLKFPEVREYHKIRLDPKFVIFFSLAFIVLILVLRFIV